MKTGEFSSFSSQTYTHTCAALRPSPSLVYHVVREENQIMCVLRLTANELMSASKYSLLTRPHLFPIFRLWKYFSSCFSLIYKCVSITAPDLPVHTHAHTHTLSIELNSIESHLVTGKFLAVLSFSSIVNYCASLQEWEGIWQKPFSDFALWIA